MLGRAALQAGFRPGARRAGAPRAPPDARARARAARARRRGDARLLRHRHRHRRRQDRRRRGDRRRAARARAARRGVQAGRHRARRARAGRLAARPRAARGGRRARARATVDRARRSARPVSPHLAAELAGGELDPAALRRRARARRRAGADVVVAEGVGGLLVPLDADYVDARLRASTLGAAARRSPRGPGLGTINHTLLTLEAARAAGLDGRSRVVLTPWPREPVASSSARTATTIARLGDVEVGVLPRVARAGGARAAGAASRSPRARRRRADRGGLTRAPSRRTRRCAGWSR